MLFLGASSGVIKGNGLEGTIQEVNSHQGALQGQQPIQLEQSPLPHHAFPKAAL